MYKLVIINIFFLLFSLSSNLSSSETHFENVYFDTVEKNIENLDLLSSEMSILFSKWYQNNIKVNGIDGRLIIKILNYDEKILKNDDSKRLDIKLKISINISKNNNLQKKDYLYEINEFGKIQGNFSLNEFDDLKENTRKNVIIRLIDKIQKN